MFAGWARSVLLRLWRRVSGELRGGIAALRRRHLWRWWHLHRGESLLMSADRSDQPARPLAARTADVAVLSLAVAVVLGDSGVVTLALPEILRDFGAAIWGVAWVLIAFNLILALVAVPAARVCVRGDPAAATAGGVIGFVAATTVCAVAPSLGVLIAARAAQAAGGALVIVGSLELLVQAAIGAERAGVRRWAAAGVAGAALGPVVGGLLTSAFSWRAIFVAQIPAVLLALPVAIALRGRVVRRRADAGHLAGPPARAGQPGAGAAVGGAHGGAVPAGAAAGGRLATIRPPSRRSPSPRCRWRRWRPVPSSAACARGRGRRRSPGRC